MRAARALAVAIAAVLGLSACTGGDDAVERGTSFEFVSPGGQLDIFYDGEQRQPAPSLAGEDLLAEGTQLAATDFPGKVVVINLWGSWCGPCRTELPEMEKLFQANKDRGLQLVGLDVREPNRSAPQDFVRDRGISYPSIYDPAGRSLLRLKGYPRNAIPSTIVLDKQQRVAAVFLRELLAEDLQPVVDRLAAE
ncbi:alkyl hydroperoxide reductase [Amycolatopsis antarctica]|uniref:Alkyl hydroperoxide reductase n=1 Tax=Amycolatopsis antarctica TaxID=1854586 RepID=A0A263DB93_9PSEU|nr:TlpA disulfide reductase family protein [Amycolatopsis antarctica]OZM74766.1 alkyl hydroperoxide reductase [Amycolatopsis antarctica]